MEALDHRNFGVNFQRAFYYWTVLLGFDLMGCDPLPLFFSIYIIANVNIYLPVD